MHYSIHRGLFAAALTLLLSSGASAQLFHGDPLYIEQYCEAPAITSGEEFDQLQRVAAKMLPSQSANVEIALIDSRIINAWTVYLNPEQSLICIPTGLVRWQEKAEGELAFIVGHEIGHAGDDTCKSARGRARLASKSRSLVTLLFGPSDGEEAGDQRSCELRADALGLELLVRAEYAATDAIAAFERMRRYSGDRRHGVLGRLVAIGEDHPITSDRIRRIKSIIAKNPALER